MEYTRQEVEKYIEEEGIDFVWLSFCDIYGNTKLKMIFSSELARAFDGGISIDAWTIAGFDSSDTRSDLVLRPDPSTMAVLPWEQNGDRGIQLYCYISWPDGRPFEADSRYILQRAVDEAERKGYFFSFGAEQEFYLFEKDEKGERTKTPVDQGGYLDPPPEDRCSGIRRKICHALEQMGIHPENAHHEAGPGQNEISYHYDSALKAADNVITFRSVVKNIADMNDAYADFSPKPLENNPGNGMHINFSVMDQYGHERLMNAIAGIMHRISDMTVFLNPEEDSYKRLGKSKAPGYITWAYENRSQMIRVPAGEGENRRAELRSPDSCANPYIAFALLIRAGIDGIDNDREPKEEAELNIYKAEREELKDYPELPSRLNEARYNAASSEFIKECLPMQVIAAYVK